MVFQTRVNTSPYCLLHPNGFRYTKKKQKKQQKRGSPFQRFCFWSPLPFDFSRQFLKLFLKTFKFIDFFFKGHHFFVSRMVGGVRKIKKIKTRVRKKKIIFKPAQFFFLSSRSTGRVGFRKKNKNKNKSGIGSRRQRRRRRFSRLISLPSPLVHISNGSLPVLFSRLPPAISRFSSALLLSLSVPSS